MESIQKPFVEQVKSLQDGFYVEVIQQRIKLFINGDVNVAKGPSLNSKYIMGNLGAIIVAILVSA